MQAISDKQFEPVIGLEIHVETNTKRKMFCDCSTDYFGKKPNSLTCPVCLGLPGALPFPNKAALSKCIRIGLGLNCEVNTYSIFERKNYFYPDLAKGYQISQLRWPLCTNGWIEIEAGDGNSKKIRINRVHQEEDTAKLVHQNREKRKEKGEKLTLIDFNRSGVPLVEIVTEPDFTSAEQVRDYAKKLQQIFRYLGVSSADMEKGQMRLEANISVREVKSKKAKGKNNELPPYRVELKNINSFRFMVAAVEYEIKRQIAALEQGQALQQETRGWDSVKKQTYVQRVKEEANDYRYFPDPDLPELTINNDQLTIIKSQMPELPAAKVKRFIADYEITPTDAQILIETQAQADYFEEVVKLASKAGATAKQIANQIIHRKVDIQAVTPTQLLEIISAQKTGMVDDQNQLEAWSKEAIKENPALVELYKKGKTTVIMALVGVVMKKSDGKAQPEKTREILEKLLG